MCFTEEMLVNFTIGECKQYYMYLKNKVLLESTIELFGKTNHNFNLH